MRGQADGYWLFFVEAYVWVVTVFFGAVVLDIVTSNLVEEGAADFSVVSDALLLLGGFAVLVALTAIAMAWNYGVTRNLIIASLAVLAFEILIPLFFSQSNQNAQASGPGAVMRLAVNGLASMLAFIGLHNLYRQR